MQLAVINATVKDTTPLFAMPLAALAGNICYLIGERDKLKAALCQQLAVAKTRLKNGDGGTITWEVWCERFVLKSDGTPYSAATIAAWVRIGQQEDVDAAYAAFRARSHDNNKVKLRGIVDLSRHSLAYVWDKMQAHDKVRRALGPVVMESLSRANTEGGEHGRMVTAFMAIWEVADESVRREVVHLIGTDYNRFIKATEVKPPL